jgi:phenylalanyl-tRNA synthetase beta chain
MLHTGQPLHAFDAARIADDTIIVRPARDGEEFYTLITKDTGISLHLMQ